MYVTISYPGRMHHSFWQPSGTRSKVDDSWVVERELLKLQIWYTSVAFLPAFQKVCKEDTDKRYKQQINKNIISVYIKVLPLIGLFIYYISAPFRYLQYCHFTYILMSVYHLRFL